MHSTEINNLIRRICQQLGIAFSANRVFPGIADLERDGELAPPKETLDAIGRQFGFRFRPMKGSIRDLFDTVSDAGPVLLISNSDEPNQEPSMALVLNVHRNHLTIHQNGSDQKVGPRWIRTHFPPEKGKSFSWLLVQPMLAAENASRFHYQGSTMSEPMKPLKRLISFLRPEAGDVKTILVFSIIIGLLSLTTPLAVEAVVNTIAFGRYLQPLIVLSLIVLTFLGFRAALNVLMTVIVEYIQRRMFVRTVEDLAYRLTRVPLSTWKKYHGPELVNRFFDIISVQKITAKIMLDSLMLLLQTVIGLSVLAFYHPFLLGYDVGLLALMTVVLYFIGRGAIKTSIAESQLKYETAAWLQEVVRHPTTFKYNGGMGFAINRADELAAEYINNRQSHFRILVRQITFSMVMQVLAATILLALGGYLVIVGQMTLGQLVAAELIVTVILGSFAKLGKDLESFYDLMASVDKLGKLFDLPIEPIDKLQLVRQPGAYQLSLVDMKLDGGSYNSCNLTFNAGLTYAIHGSSELRRSKLIESMVGQTKPASGYVLLNDFRVDTISSESLQEKVSLIRDIEIFDGSVDENIRMGRADIGSDDVNRVISGVNLQKTISGLQAGLVTRLSISGYPLSQGQAIRVVLARALIAKPGILFVDGLLDRLSDKDTADVLHRLKSFQSDTTIVISTGRQVIADWAEQNLNISMPVWELAKSSG